MKKSAVAGVAGAVRIYQLTNNDLRKAENHGKRLDETSKARAIYDAPPVTTSGLELRTLFRAHIKGAFVPKAKAKAMHVIIQFPKELVDGENAEYMLHHARRFCERVFGTDAIFADRVDRDERGRHVVDAFVAPKYIKTTKHQAKLAVTMSRHLKDLAVRYGQDPTPRGSALALQDALFEYFRDEMGLQGVKRGAPKLIAGPDWRSAEQLRDAELTEKEHAAQERSRELVAREAAVTNMEAAARAAREAADEERAETTRLRDKAAGDAAAAAAARESAEAARIDADSKSQEATARLEAARRREEEQAARLGDLRRRADEARAEAERAQAEALKARADRIKADLEAVAARTKASEDQFAASRARRNAEDTHKAADALLASVMADKRRLDEERSVHVAQLALLARASDDQSGLDLRTNATTFTLNSNRMTPEESAAVRNPWSAGLNIIARTLAIALERIRALKDRLAARETELEKQKRDADARDARLRDERERHARDVEGHRAALCLLDQQQVDVTEREKCAKDALAAARGKADEAAAVEIAARAALADHQRWVMVVNALSPFPDGTRIMGDRIVANPSVVAKLTPPMAAFIKLPAPDWARMVVAERFATDQERQKAQSAAVALEKMLGEARTVLSPAQQQTVAQARQVMRQHGFPDPGMGL